MRSKQLKRGAVLGAHAEAACGNAAPPLQPRQLCQQLPLLCLLEHHCAPGLLHAASPLPAPREDVSMHIAELITAVPQPCNHMPHLLAHGREAQPLRSAGHEREYVSQHVVIQLRGAVAGACLRIHAVPWYSRLVQGPQLLVSQQCRFQCQPSSEAVANGDTPLRT